MWIAPEVGGGFGSKSAAYPADFITLLLAMTLNRPVKWAETPTAARISGDHSRPPHVQEVELAARKDGTVLGLRATVSGGEPWALPLDGRAGDPTIFTD